MKKTFFFSLGLLLILSTFNGFSQQSKFEGKRLLIYTKNGKGYVHKNIATSVETLEKICKSLGVETVVSKDPALFTRPEINRFDVVVFANTNNEAFDTEQQREAFKKYCQSGKGFGGIHSATGSERHWPWFWKLIGGSFLRHPPFQTFTVKVNRSNHPSTQHLGSTFDLDDECYFIKNSNPSFKILLEADLSTVSENDKGKKVFRPERAPLSWYNTFDGGKQWYTALGHSKDLYALPWFQRHLQGGIEYLLEE